MDESTLSTRRSVLRTTGAVVAGTTVGCLGLGEDGSDDGAIADDATPERDPALAVDGRHLLASRPLELVEPDVEPFEGVAASERQGLVTYVHWHDDPTSSHWHFTPLAVPDGSERAVRSRFVDAGDRGPLPLGPGKPFDQVVRVADGEETGVVSADVEGDRVTFSGDAPGRVDVVVALQGAADRWDSPPLPVRVGDSAAD